MADLFLNPFPQLEFMTTIGLDVVKVLKNLKDLGIEQHLERVHKKFSDQIGWNAMPLRRHDKSYLCFLF